MDIKDTGYMDGRDATELFTNDTPPTDWNDIAIVRGGRITASWLAACTGRYKLVVSPWDTPWLIDMEQDPDELKNYYSDPAYREVTRNLAKELLTYGKKFNDLHIADPKTASDLAKLSE